MSGIDDAGKSVADRVRAGAQPGLMQKWALNRKASEHWTVDEIEEEAGHVYAYLLQRDSATRAEIRSWCKERGIQASLYQRAFARLDRQANIIERRSDARWALTDRARQLGTWDKARQDDMSGRFARWRRRRGVRY